MSDGTPSTSIRGRHLYFRDEPDSALEGAVSWLITEDPDLEPARNRVEAYLREVIDDLELLFHERDLRPGESWARSIKIAASFLLAYTVNGFPDAPSATSPGLPYIVRDHLWMLQDPSPHMPDREPTARFLTSLMTSERQFGSDYMPGDYRAPIPSN